MAVETNTDAYLPVTIALLKLQFKIFFEKFFSLTTKSSSSSTKQTKTESSTTIDLDSSWDLYVMVVLLGLIGALYTMRRQRAALQQQQQPVQAPVQWYL